MILSLILRRVEARRAQRTIGIGRRTQTTRWFILQSILDNLSQRRTIAIVRRQSDKL